MAPPALQYPEPRLRGGLIRQRAGGIEEDVRPYAPEVGAYPAPKINRIGALDPAAALAAAALPRTRIFAFSVAVVQSATQWVASNRIVGPSIIKGATVAKNATPKGTQAWGIGKSLTAISNGSVATGGVLPFLPLFDSQQLFGPGSTTFSTPSDGSLDLQSTLTQAIDLDIIVPETEWFLVVYAASDGFAGTDTFAGAIRLIESVSPSALANFL